MEPVEAVGRTGSRTKPQPEAIRVVSVAGGASCPTPPPIANSAGLHRTCVLDTIRRAPRGVRRDRVRLGGTFPLPPGLPGIVLTRFRARTGRWRFHCRIPCAHD